MATKKNPNYGNTQAIIIVIALLAGIAYLALIGTATRSPANYTTVPVPMNASVYTAQQELPNMSIYDPNLTLSSFYCSTSNQCALVHTSDCFNNAPSQQACIGASYSNQYNSSFGNYWSTKGATMCPEFYMLGNASCACIDNGCSLIYQRG